ncbi:NAD-dependent epimerase/dehydratase family protein [Actinomycetospora termitidis]|uniref:UDP-glucose 4-epimerase n=1 Tax=Actinomycetospora termitidis TaxID=3053470 RepID=A0ABT7M6C4_9PSEU|nr:NAD-dependent epimerase/dehydratase family protein [Actinomycetospora sp. Odt1-22]MDL5156225.1 NAD-dependent epimerase/dehydratase family protein [Actinomycetospora sp. Odt1-22]
MGGTRFLGVEVVEALLERGHEVTVFHRGTRAPVYSAPVTEVHGDRDVPENLAPLAALDLDTVLDLSAYTRAQTERLLAALPDVERYVHCSTLNVYRPSPLLPWPEDTPYGPHRLWGRYATEKIGCELALREARPEPLTTASIRLPLVLGPGNYIAREEFVLNRLLDAETILLSGDGQAVHQYVWLRHAAAALARATELAVEGFAAYNVASRRCITSLEGFVEVCAEVSGTTPRLRTVGGGPTGEDLAVFNGVDCVFPFSNENTVGDIGAADAAGLLEPYLPLHEMIAAALEHLLAHPERRSWSRTEAEKRVLARVGDEQLTRAR